MAARLERDDPGGATKLNKLLWYADIEHVRRYGNHLSSGGRISAAHRPIAGDYIGLVPFIPFAMIGEFV